MIQVFFIILRHDILLSCKSSGKILANFLFFLISTTLFLLVAKEYKNQEFLTFYFITIILFSLLSCLIFSNSDFLKKDFEDGTIEQILLSCENFEIFILAKTIANWLFFSLPVLLLIPTISLAMDIDIIFVKKFLILAALASLTINFIATFCGSLSVFENSIALIGTIALPLIIPSLLITYSGVSQVGQETFDSAWKILAGFTIFIGSISTLATAKIVKIAAE